MVVNLDPFQEHRATITLPDELFSDSDHEQVHVQELLTGESYLWTGRHQSISLYLGTNPVTILSLKPWVHQDFVEPSD